MNKRVSAQGQKNRKKTYGNTTCTGVLIHELTRLINEYTIYKLDEAYTTDEFLAGAIVWALNLHLQRLESLFSDGKRFLEERGDGEYWEIVDRLRVVREELIIKHIQEQKEWEQESKGIIN